MNFRPLGHFFARFAVCHTLIMDKESLVEIRNYLRTAGGQYLINYLSDYITDNACKQREASEIKGMCELLQQIKLIPNKVEQLRRN